jgi:alpha,alpha-trehalose-phosphate synthase [UDP-forming]
MEPYTEGEFVITTARKTTAPGVRSSRSVLLDGRFLPERFLVVSNRLPYRLTLKDGRVEATRAVGGLVTALDPILRAAGGTWLGWSGTQDKLPETVPIEGSGPDYTLRLIHLTPQEFEDFYLGYPNQSLWPLFHYFQENCEFNDEQWAAYERVNRKFADAVIGVYREGDIIWIHDYHLMLMPAMVRRALPEARIGYFLHIPFPSPELFLIDPHAPELIAGLAGADLVGFHTETYAQNFVHAADTMTPFNCSRARKTIQIDDRVVQIGSFPISIAFEEFEQIAARPGIDAQVAQIRKYYDAEILALGVDRLDYTKGILERLQAIEILLERHPDLQGRFTFVQISAPSRTHLPAYGEMREKVEQMVGRINGRFAGHGGLPVDYRYQAYTQEELVAYYRAADMALVTPLRDGMNLVAKEYVASRSDLAGSLVLSRFTGAFEELDGAFVVNPYHAESMAEAIYRALTVTPEDKQNRMRRMRDVVRRNDIYWWLERYLRAFD